MFNVREQKSAITEHMERFNGEISAKFLVHVFVMQNNILMIGLLLLDREKDGEVWTQSCFSVPDSYTLGIFFI